MSSIYKVYAKNSKGEKQLDTIINLKDVCAIEILDEYPRYTEHRVVFNGGAEAIIKTDSELLNSYEKYLESSNEKQRQLECNK